MVNQTSIRKAKDREDLPEINATYFGGIVSFNSAAEYGKYLRKIMSNEIKTYTMFANQVYSVAQINQYKHGHMQSAIKYFAVAIISELLIVMSVAFSWSSSFLFGN